MLWEINETLFLMFYQLAHRTPLGDWAIVFFAEILPLLLVASLLVHLFFLPKKEREQEFFFVFAPATLAVILSWAVELMFPFPRPFAYSIEIAPLVFVSDAFGAFPSTHTIFFASLGYALFLHDKRWGEFILLFAMMIGLSRVAAGVHWPIDIFCGFFLGILVAQMAHFFETRAGRASFFSW